MTCRGCEWREQIERGRHPDFVAALPESYVLLADEQVYRGYCIVLLRDHAEHLADLPLERQLRLHEDVARVAGAVRDELDPRRINYACLGNFVTHVHWHVIPRYADDPEPLHPIWVRPLAERKVALPASERAELIARLRRRLAR
jgi:diadenosine tetraphosphate (Ap4A) HIT family hydrolase